MSGRTVSDYRITLLPGDGTGNEVVTQAKKVLNAIQENSNLGFDFTTIECGGLHFKEHGTEWAEGSFELCRDESDAILLGAIGWPGIRRENGDLAGGEVVLGLRAGLELYANVRPIKLYEGVSHKVHGKFTKIWDSEKVDLLILRENTEGLYYSTLQRSVKRIKGEKFREYPEIPFPELGDEVAWDPRPISRMGTERVVRRAFEYARKRGEKSSEGRVTCVDKSNVTKGCQLFRSVFDEVSQEYPSIGTSHAYVDAFTMWMVRNPEDFDVVVTSNLFGDIVTDLGSVLQGGMGMAASGNIGDSHGLFEPVHGSSPKYAGLNKVNPIAAINSAQMMLEWIGNTKEDSDAKQASQILSKCVGDHIRNDAILTYDLGGNSTTSQVGEAIASRVGTTIRELM